MGSTLPSSASVSVVIPTLNEAEHLGATLEALGRVRGIGEVIVADGGSTDDTAAIAARAGARVLSARCGRGSQLHAGALTSRGKVLWFLHADTLAPVEAAEVINRALANPAVVGGHFTLRFDGDRRAARLLTWVYPRLCWLGLRYGDSAYFARRDAYERAGGFRPYPLFEDLDLWRRLRRYGRMVRVPATVVTSSRRFEGRSFTLTFAHWTCLQLLYWAGVSPHRIGRLYAHVRGPRGMDAAGSVGGEPFARQGPGS
jgi:rSAM/selenodomain-associated transferase 2